MDNEELNALLGQMQRQKQQKQKEAEEQSFNDLLEQEFQAREKINYLFALAETLTNQTRDRYS